jgi:hypothetical protein
MRKMIFLAVAGFLWRQVRTRIGRRMAGGRAARPGR